MAKRLPTPPTPPSTHASRVIRSVRQMADRECATAEEYAQRIVDLLHVEAAVQELIDPAFYRAVSPEYRLGPHHPPRTKGYVSFGEMARLTGLVKSAVQRRVGNGAEITREHRKETG